jgi:hypothetical protein
LLEVLEDIRDFWRWLQVVGGFSFLMPRLYSDLMSIVEIKLILEVVGGVLLKAC